MDNHLATRDGLAVRNVVKTYNNNKILEDISLDVSAGHLVTLLGPSGCGKTTLLKIISGFVSPDAGQIILNGDDISNVPPYRRTTSMVFQEYTLLPHMSVLDNVMFGLRLRKIEKREALKQSYEALELVRLSHISKNAYPSQLSGGQKQRVAIARSLVLNPDLLLLDEPFGALDRQLRVELQVELRKLQMKLGITTVCVTHDQEEAMTISDYVALMSNGQIEQYCTPTELYDHPTTEFTATFIGTNNVFTCDAQEASGCGYRLELASGEIIMSATQSVELSPPCTVKLALRPEYVRLSEPYYCDEALLGTVLFSNNLGSHVNYEVETSAGLKLYATASVHMRERIFAIGDSIAITLLMENAVVLERYRGKIDQYSDA